MCRGSFLAAIATSAATMLLAVSPAFGAVSVKTTMARAELVIPGVSPEQAISAVHDGMSGWVESLPISQQPLPDPLPARPGKPTTKQLPLGPVKATVLDCATATAEITKQSAPTKNQMAFNQDIFQGCVYPFEKGVKVYLQAINIDAAESSITAGLFSGIANTIRGTPGEWLNRRLNDMIAKLREKLPKVLVERIEAPGVPIQQPDKDEVLALIPPEQEKPVAAAPVAVPTVSAVSPVAVAAPVMQGQASMIEARKELHAMGHIYHSQEQFVAAIRRRDELAVRLFVQGGGVDLGAKDATGKTPTEIAKETSSETLVRLLQGDAKVQTSAAPAVTVVPVAQKSTPPAMIPGRLSPEQQEQIRQQIMMQMQAQGLGK